jgi:DNA-binding MarR family transcriptional regulator
MLPRRTRPIDDLVFEVFRLNAALLDAGDAAVKGVGLTSARWQVLGAVMLATSPVTVSQIARNMGLTRQGVQRITNELVQSGLIALEENPRHRSARIVVPTDAGELAYDVALQEWREKWTSEMEGVLADSEIIETMKRLRLLRGLLRSRMRVSAK